MEINLASIRQEYTKGGLRESELPDNPFLLFSQWLQEAIDSKVDEPTAMLHDDKFIFYSNYESRKGRQLAQNPAISLSFVWHQLERQVHIEGTAEKVPPDESDQYFKKRPYKSRIGARISPQSQPIGNRVQLIRAFIREAARWIGKEVERPAHWGGYAVIPERIEFWQGRPNRLHDRIVYTFQPDGHWKKERLAP